MVVSAPRADRSSHSRDRWRSDYHRVDKRPGNLCALPYSINRPQAPISEVNAEPIRHQRQLGYTLDREVSI